MLCGNVTKPFIELYNSSYSRIIKILFSCFVYCVIDFLIKDKHRPLNFKEPRENSTLPGLFHWHLLNQHLLVSYNFEQVWNMRTLDPSVKI